jgi:uncharacterized membrane protein YdjX (TVP38/TMEM64 family)
MLPLDRWIEDMKLWLDGFGVLGMAVFVVIYVAAAVLLVPGLALTIAAGGMYGLFWGTVLVSIASTAAAAIAFLIARYLARGAVEARAAESPKFAAIDRAIEQGGWRIVALLRLSPAMPFSLGNYLYGLTAIRFWPYVLTSWLFMLPGTFMYVYVGYLSTEGLSAASGGDESTATGRLVLFVVGLVATVAVTVYVSRLARRALREQTEIG